MKVFLVLCAITLAYAYPSQSDWDNFKAEHGKVYKNAQEEHFRKNVFLDNKRKINQHNAAFGAGRTSYTMKMNQFGDLMTHEFKAAMNGFKQSGSNNQGTIFYPTNVNVPATVDWRKKGAVTPVKDQGQCGSCWAFSTTGSLEGQLFLKKGKLVSLSEQNLVDCSGNYGNYGCSGGLMDQAFDYIKDNGGIDTEKSYPYEATDGSCRFKASNVGGTDTGYVDISSGDEDALKEAVATVGPVSVAIDAGHQSFQFYSSGIYDEPNCSSYSLDHGVLAVGYGTDNGKDYWLVKNSWNTVWGSQGYIKMTRNNNNQCGIATQASYPRV